MVILRSGWEGDGVENRRRCLDCQPVVSAVIWEIANILLEKHLERVQ